jgi:hypothetical protein
LRPHAERVRPVAGRDDLGRLRELADELTADQRLVLARQVALDMDCQEFSACTPAPSALREYPAALPSHTPRQSVTSAVPTRQIELRH